MPIDHPTSTPRSNILMLCQDTDRVMQFCRTDPFRYRHMISEMKHRDQALAAAWCKYYGIHPLPPSQFYVNAQENVTLLAAYRNDRLRLEGSMEYVDPGRLRDWCTRLAPKGVASTSEPIRDLLCEVVGRDNWSINFHYLITAQRFRERVSHEVVRLTPSKRSAFEAFLQRPSDTPFLSVRHSEPALVRDFAFMSAGLPIICYAVFAESDIAGILTTNPLSDFCVETSRLYVARNYRGRGVGQSLLSVATREALEQGLMSGFSVSGDLEVLDRFLTGLGYEVATPFWHKRYWTDTPQAASRKLAHS